MKRVSNKSGQLVRSASRRKKSASRFQFDVTIDKVYGVKAGATYIVKWSRGVKVAQSKPHPATKEAAGKAGLAVNEKLSLLVTLYREDNRKFDSKDSKISLVSVSPKKQERTTAKIHFDISQFAGVPHASSTKLFKLSDKVSIRATVESRFLKAGSGGSGSTGASSALSGVSARSSDDELEDDFDDLALDDIPESDHVSKSKPPFATAVARQSSNGPSSRVPLIVETPRPSSSLSSERAKAPTPSPLSSSSVTSSESPNFRSARSRPAPISPAEVKAFAQTESTQQLTSLRKENKSLSADLAKYEKERSSLEESHRRQLEELNLRLTEQTKENHSIDEERTRNLASIAELRKNNKILESKAKVLQGELDGVKRDRDRLSVQCKKLGPAEEKCKELSKEVDRLVVAAATSRGESSDQSHASEIEKRMDALREERDRVERKVRSHESHAAKTKAAYQKLTELYNSMREQHVTLVHEMKELKAKKCTEPSSASPAATNERTDVPSQLEEALQEIQDVKASKESLQSDYDHLLSQTDSVQERLERLSRELEDVRRENDELHAETEELKGQRDVAMQRALSRGKSSSGNGENRRSIDKVEDEMRLTKEKLEREMVRLTRRNAELESETGDLKEDIEYEKTEKTKAREERDKLRESVRALERRTSQAAKQNDEMQSMRRQLSTHHMREQNRESTITSLRSEVTALRSELEEAREGSLVKSNSRDNIGDVLQDLVSTKLALAQTEDEKLNLQFAMKKLKKSEKAIQQKLAAHASRLEVKLGQANEELERLRKRRGLENASEFNELGSDVDY